MFRQADPLSEQVSQALLGMPVRQLGGRDPWRRIETPDGYRGWVAAAAVLPCPEGWAPPWVEMTDLWVNLRAVDDSRAAAAFQAVIGTRLPLTGRSEGWAQVLLPDGRRLWTEARRVRPAGERPLYPARPRAVCRTARRFLGIPYLWGGCSPLGLDCSGFVQLVMRLHGVALPRDAHEQARRGEPVEAPAAGDLVFFGPEEARITHVGLMLDGERFIHAAGSDRVRVNRLRDPPYAGICRGGRRCLPAA